MNPLRIFSLFLALGIAIAGPAFAQPFPNRTIHFIVPVPAGGGGDAIARAVAQKMAESMGQPVIVENKPGAAAQIATDYVARATPDGYTILFMSDGHAINAALYSKLPYDSRRDFAPVSRMFTVPFVLLGSPDVQASSFPELVNLIRHQPGKLSYGSIGTGSPHHMAMEMLKAMGNLDVLHVPYKGSAPALIATVGGQVQLAFSGLASAGPLVQSGKLKPFAVTTAQRVPAYPDLPTIAEGGFPGYDMVSWIGVVAPARTPDAIVARLSAEINKALSSADVRERFGKLGLEASGSTPAEFGVFIESEIAKWARVVKATGVKPD